MSKIRTAITKHSVLQIAQSEEDLDNVRDALSKQQLKETQHKEKIQSLLEKADSFRVCTVRFAVQKVQLFMVWC